MILLGFPLAVAFCLAALGYRKTGLAVLGADCVLAGFVFYGAMLAG